MRGRVSSLASLALCLGPSVAFVAPVGPRTASRSSPLFSAGSRASAIRASQRPSTRVLVDPAGAAEAATKVVAAQKGAIGAAGGLVASVLGGSLAKTVPLVVGVLALALIGLRAPIAWLQKGWRSYDREENSVGREYDAWTREKILEHYWGEHIHLGYYSDEVQKEGYLKKSFIGAKYDFIDRMMEFAGLDSFKPRNVLDVGCGIGGTTRYLAKKLGSDVAVEGITLSKEQVNRANELAGVQQVPNAKFAVMDALQMSYPDNSFDLVWACESGEHMPDKKAYVEEMIRVLKPGGTLVIACWCQRDNSTQPFTPAEQKRIDFMCTEWSHPYFISIKDFENLALNTGVMEKSRTEDWARFTLPSWRHSIWVGVFDPVFWMLRPHLWIKILRDAFTLNVFHNAFKDGLMGYGMITATKKQQ